MKAETKIFKLCQEKSKQLFWGSRSLSLQESTSQANRSRVFQVLASGLSVWATAVNEVLSSKRYTAGVVFLLVIAPASSVFYQLFNREVLNMEWYYVNKYYFVYTLSPYLMLFFASVGIFLLFPVKCKTAYLATVLPAGYAVAKIINYSFFVNSNADFHQPIQWVVVVVGIFIAIGFLLTANYLLYRKYHLRDGTLARIVGIIKAPGLDAQTKMQLLETQSLELENFNQRY